MLRSEITVVVHSSYRPGRRRTRGDNPVGARAEPSQRDRPSCQGLRMSLRCANVRRRSDLVAGLSRGKATNPATLSRRFLDDSGSPSREQEACRSAKVGSHDPSRTTAWASWAGKRRVPARAGDACRVSWRPWLPSRRSVCDHGCVVPSEPWQCRVSLP